MRTSAVIRSRQSWGRNITSLENQVVPQDVEDLQGLIRNCADREAGFLAVGAGRSYGDCGLNDGGTSISLHKLDRVTSFDPERGRLTVQSGATLNQVLRIIIPAGWTLPVLPGTSHITIGGAVANDIHGKNHPGEGSFGDHIDWLEIVRSDHSEPVKCLPDDELFKASIGGLGLTGILVSVGLRLKPLVGMSFRTQASPLDDLAHLAGKMTAHARDWPEQVCVLPIASGKIGQGKLLLAKPDAEADPQWQEAPVLSVPAMMPRVVSPELVSLFQTLSTRRDAPRKESRRSFRGWHFPLDRIGHWNRLYGSSGLVQLQFVVPGEDEWVDVLEEIVSRTRRSPAVLCVVKRFGPSASVGMMSFPLAGMTVALDFVGSPQLRSELGPVLDIIASRGGRVYLAKDSILTAGTASLMYPLYRFSSFVDPQCSSSLWRRISG